MRTLGLHPLIGSPETIAKELMRLNEMGIDAVTLSFVNSTTSCRSSSQGLLRFLRQAGLRNS